MKLSKAHLTKYSGAGNTFTFLAPIQDHNLSPSQVLSICAEASTDGLIYLSATEKADIFFMHFFNSDGSQPGLCGNGLRSSMAFLKDQGYLSEQAFIKTPSGIYTVGYEREHFYSVCYPQPSCYKPITLAEYPGLAYFVDVGIPHLVVPVSNLENLDIQNIGALLRSSKSLNSDGANVNFYCSGNHAHTKIRTYERGVEGETLACGTGALSTFWVLKQTNSTEETSLPIQVRSGDILYHEIASDFIKQSGPVQKDS